MLSFCIFFYLFKLIRCNFDHDGMVFDRPEPYDERKLNLVTGKSGDIIELPEQVLVVDWGDTAKYNLVQICEGAFSGCTVKTIKIPKTVEIIGKNAFNSCGLEKIEFLDAHISEITTLNSYAFANNPNLTSINWPSITINDVSLDDHCFYKTGFIQLDLPKYTIKIGDSAFEESIQLSVVDIGLKITSLSTKAFYNCKNLKSVYIPITLITLGDSCFENTFLQEYPILSECNLEKMGKNCFAYTHIKKFYSTQKFTSIPAPEHQILAY